MTSNRLTPTENLIPLGIGVAVADQFHPDIDGGEFFAAHGLGTGLGHADHLGGMHDADPRISEFQALAGTFIPQHRFIPHQKQMLQFGIKAQCFKSPSDIDRRGVVPAHGVQD